MAILGIDEVGRGPIAGPLVVGAVILPEDKENHPWINELNDSKKLTPKKREQLSELIIREAPAYALGWVESRELDQLGMSKALRLAAIRALRGIKLQAKVGSRTSSDLIPSPDDSAPIKISEIIIDGTINFLADTPMEPYVSTLKKADLLIKEVSAASIIAKVARDHYMINLSDSYPEYGFDTHMGYGTKRHYEAINKFGNMPEHRLSFKGVKQCKKNTTILGKQGEEVVAEYLHNNGHSIIARNFKTKTYEIDIISIKDDRIYFTEVKYRKNSLHGDPLEAITVDKQKRMQFAAEAFMKFQPVLTKELNPILAVSSVLGENFEFQNWFELNWENHLRNWGSPLIISL